MSGKGDFQLCVLWEAELRAAARLIERADALPPEDPGFGMAAAEAFQACRVALFHVSDERALVLVGSDEIKKRMDEYTAVVKQKKKSKP